VERTACAANSGNSDRQNPNYRGRWPGRLTICGGPKASALGDLSAARREQFVRKLAGRWCARRVSCAARACNPRRHKFRLLPTTRQAVTLVHPHSVDALGDGSAARRQRERNMHRPGHCPGSRRPHSAGTRLWAAGMTDRSVSSRRRWCQRCRTCGRESPAPGRLSPGFAPGKTSLRWRFRPRRTRLYVDWMSDGNSGSAGDVTSSAAM